MAIYIVEVNLVGDNSRGNVLIESDLPKFPAQIEELGSAAARTAVLSAVVENGVRGQPGISRMSDPPYPVNSEGETIENLKDDDGNPLPPSSPRCQPARYRARYEITAKQ